MELAKSVQPTLDLMKMVKVVQVMNVIHVSFFKKMVFANLVKTSRNSQKMESHVLYKIVNKMKFYSELLSVKSVVFSPSLILLKEYVKIFQSVENGKKSFHQPSVKIAMIMKDLS